MGGHCGTWGTVDEVAVLTALGGSAQRSVLPAVPAVPISSIDPGGVRHYPTGVSELDRVLDGGVVPGSVTLLAGALGRKTLGIANRLQSWDPDDLLNTPTQDVIDQLVDDGIVERPHLLTDKVFMLEPTEIHQQYVDFGRPLTRRVTRLVAVLPFEGERDVFLLRAQTFSHNPPRVLRLEEQELHLAVDDPPDDPAQVRAMFDAMIAKIDDRLGWSRQQIEMHNEQLRRDVPNMVANRRDQLLSTRNLQAQIGFPIRRRSDADTYAVPVKRKAIRPQQRRPSGARASFKPEPVLEDADYQDALRVLRSQAVALERTPSRAAKHNEEEIRDLLLVGLNGHFEGSAAGELFNGAGKTDILIRADNRNIFIGEGKVWHGPTTMDEALGQLFSYLVWRDTKAAILLFIRDKDVTAVIEKAIAKIEQHPNYKRSRPRHSDHEYEYTMHAQDDPEREIHLTLIPFALRAA
jgi:hypothetical protein